MENKQPVVVESALEFPGLGDRLLVVFDGQCGFCNRSIRWFLKRDVLDRLRFTPSDSPAVANLRTRHNLSALSPNTMVVVQHPGEPHERLLTRSNGVLAMLSELPNPWPVLPTILRILPRPIRDLGYRLIAAIRYRISRRLAACPIPTLEERRHFL